MERQLQTQNLPKFLNCLLVKGNNLSGTVDLGSLPRRLQALDLSGNSFEYEGQDKIGNSDLFPELNHPGHILYFLVPWNEDERNV